MATPTGSSTAAALLRVEHRSSHVTVIVTVVMVFLAAVLMVTLGPSRWVPSRDDTTTIEAGSATAAASSVLNDGGDPPSTPPVRAAAGSGISPPQSRSVGQPPDDRNRPTRTSPRPKRWPDRIIGASLDVRSLPGRGASNSTTASPVPSATLNPSVCRPGHLGYVGSYPPVLGEVRVAEGGGGYCCSTVPGDLDQGYTLRHHLTRLLCASSLEEQQRLYRNEKLLLQQQQQQDVKAMPSTRSRRITNQTTPAPRPRVAAIGPVPGRPIRVLQIGANTGDNVNDHLNLLLRTGFIDTVAVEPVPWLFQRLQQTYAHIPQVRTVSFAVTPSDGLTSFQAPRQNATGYVPQMGGLSVPPMSIGHAGGASSFETITVQGLSVLSLLSHIGWLDGNDDDDDEAAATAINRGGSVVGGGRSATRTAAWLRMPDVIVIDVEGFDVDVMQQVINASRVVAADWLHKRQTQTTTAATSPVVSGGGGVHSSGRTAVEVEVASSSIADGFADPRLYPAIIQWEWKHVNQERNIGLIKRLEDMGYCVQYVYYDCIAVLPSANALFMDHETALSEVESWRPPSRALSGMERCDFPVTIANK